MGKIRYTVRLYRVHDLDLITFVEQHEFNLAKAVYSALSAFTKGDHFVIEIPPKRKKEIPEFKRVYQKPIYLDEEKDKKAIELLDKIQKGYRNNFFKNLLRLYLCTPVSVAFLNNPDDEDMFVETFEIFKENKRLAKAGKINENDGKAQKPVYISTTNLGNNTEISEVEKKNDETNPNTTLKNNQDKAENEDLETDSGACTEKSEPSSDFEETESYYNKEENTNEKLNDEITSIFNELF